MTNEEIKALLRELAAKAEADGEVRSKTVRITLEPKEAESKEKPAGLFSGHRREKAEETASEEPSAPAGKAGTAEEGEGEEDQAPVKNIREQKLHWELPEDEPEEDDDEPEDLFISVLPKQSSGKEQQMPEQHEEEGSGEETEDPGEEKPEKTALLPGLTPLFAFLGSKIAGRKSAKKGLTGQRPSNASAPAREIWEGEETGSAAEAAEESFAAEEARALQKDDAKRQAAIAGEDREAFPEGEEDTESKEETEAKEDTKNKEDTENKEDTGSTGKTKNEAEDPWEAEETERLNNKDRTARRRNARDLDERSKTKADFESDAADFTEEPESGGAAFGLLAALVGAVTAKTADAAKKRKKKAASDKEEGRRPVSETLEKAQEERKEQGTAEDAKESVADTAGRSAGGSAADTAGRSAGESVAETAGGSAAETAGESVAETAGGSAAETAGESAAETAEGDTAEANETEEDRIEDRAVRKNTSKHASEEKPKMSFLAELREKGISVREWIMVFAGLLLLVLVIAMIASALRNGKKSENVTADAGLSVRIEKEPKQWCNEGQVVLGIRTGSPIQSITINGVAQEFSGTKRTKLTYEANTHDLDIMVVSEESVLKASAVLEMVDATDPLLTISMDGTKAVLEAQDDESGLDGIFYGELVGLSDVPAYQPYTGPFTPKEDTLYSLFARDVAGNCSERIVTDLTPATSLKLGEEQISLFPGETVQLPVRSVPDHSFVNGLRMENSDSSVITLRENGSITALEEGTAVVQVEADGLEPVTCRVTVRSQAQVTLSAIGDVTLGDDVNFSPLNSFSTVQSMNGNAYFFNNVRDIFEADDITFANLEGTLTDQGERQDKQFAFRGAPSFVQILVDGGVDVVTLANNHSRDYGDISLEDTKKNLEQAGIEYCIGDIIAYEEADGVKVALIGIYVLDDGLAKTEQVEQTVSQARAEGAELIVVAFHWGTEMSTSPDEVQQSLAHTAIDCGADLVVGHHPHVLQGVERYQGKYIVYSLGNFCFGGNSSPSDMDTMIFQQTFHISPDGTISYDDVEVIPCSVSSQSSWNNYQPTPVEGEERQRIIAKLNERSAQFGVSF